MNKDCVNIWLYQTTLVIELHQNLLISNAKKPNHNIPIAIRAIYRVNVHVTMVYASINICFIHVAPLCYLNIQLKYFMLHQHITKK